MEWGILMAGMTVFGMLALLIAAVRTEEEPVLDDRVECQSAGSEQYRQAA